VADIIYRADAMGWRGDTPVPLDALVPGDTVVVDITLRSTEPMRAIEASVVDFDRTIVGLDPEASAVASIVLAASCTASGDCSGGLFNRRPAGPQLREEEIGGVGTRVFFLSGWATDEQSEGDGSVDPGVVTGQPGDPQFRVVFTALAIGSTTLRVATDPRYENVSISIFGAPPRFYEEAVVPVRVVPEPSEAILLALGLAVLGAHRSVRER